MSFTDPTNMTPPASAPSMASLAPSVTGSSNPVGQLSPTQLQQIIQMLGQQNNPVSQTQQAIGQQQLMGATPMANAGSQAGSLGTATQNGISPQAYQQMMGPMGTMGY